MPPWVATTAEVFEYALAGVGVLLAWLLVVSPKARAQRREAQLPVWNAQPLEILQFLVVVMVGAFLAAALAGIVSKGVGWKGEDSTLAGGAAAQFGMLAGALGYAIQSPGFRSRASLSTGAILGSGAATFLISLPILLVTSQLWQWVLQSLHVPLLKQELIDTFAQAKNPWFLFGLIALATVVAPITEELVFRAGMFRFLRGRVPRIIALLLPAMFFAALHVNWANFEGLVSFVPLVVLAVVFSLALERTGHIGTAIVAHALFNLNTVLLIFCGVTT